MGNDSSITSNVYSLNTSLGQIEERLFRIENIHLHHQTCFNVDDSILISGKKIKCSRNVRVITGPVLGLIGTSRATILVEVDVSATITFNLFRSDKYTIGDRFIESKSISLASFSPTAIVLDGLAPGTPYTIYIGGIDGEQTIHKPVRFSTISDDAENVIFSSCSLGVTEHTDKSQYSRSMQSLVSSRERYDFDQVFMLGNLVSVAKTIDFYYKTIWESLSAFDGTEQWKTTLTDFERALQGHYRSFFNDPFVAELTTSGAFLPIAGCGESGRRSVEMILESILDILLDAEGQEKRTSMVESGAEKSTGTGAQGWASRRIKKAQDSAPTRSTSIVQTLPAIVMAEMASLSQSSIVDISERAELQKLLLFLIASITRLVYAQYFRQLWDSQFSVLQETELKIQLLLKNVLTLRSRILRQNRLMYQLTENQKRYMAQFHHSDTSTEESVKALQIEVQSSKQKVVTYLQMIAELGDSQGSWTEPKFLSLGSGVFYIVCDCEWFWMERYLDLKAPLTKPCSIPETAIKKIKELLSDSSPSKDAEEVNCVVCILPKMSLDPQSDWLMSLLPLVYESVNMTANIALVDKDFRRLVLELSSWQRRLESRSALIVCGGAYSSSSQVFFHVDHEPLSDEKQQKSFDEYHKSRNTISALVAGRVCSHNEQLYSFLHHRQWLMFQRRMKPAEFSLDAKRITVVSDPRQKLASNAIWRSKFSPCNSSLGKSRGVSVFEKQLNSFLSDNCCLRGMVMGRVSDRSSTVLVETAEDGVLTLICEDSSTGTQFCSRQEIRCGRPSIFQFTGLDPERHYHVYSVKNAVEKDYSLSFSTSMVPKHSSFKIVFLSTSNFMEIVRSLEANPSSRDFSVLLQSLRSGGEQLKKFASLLTWPWSGINVVIHSRCPLDTQHFLPRVVSLLHLAEAYSSTGVTDQTAMLLEQAKETIRDAYRSAYFSDSTYSRLLQHESHFIPPLSPIDILQCCGYSGIDVLYRELTHTIADTFLKLLDEVSNEYCQAQWLTAAHLEGRNKDTGYMINESVYLYNLSLEFKSSYSKEGSLLDPHQLDNLRHYLGNNKINTLLLFSPIPIIDRNSTAFADQDFGYTHFLEQDVISVLDICLSWVLGDMSSTVSTKSIVFLCGTSTSSEPVIISLEMEEQRPPNGDESFDLNNVLMQKLRIGKINAFQQLACRQDSSHGKYTLPWQARFQSRYFPHIFFRCQCGSSSADEKTSDSLESFGFVLDVVDSELNVLELGAEFIEEALFNRSSSIVGIPSDISKVMASASQLLRNLYQSPIGDIKDMGSSSVDLQQYRDVLEVIIANEVSIVEKVFDAFSHGNYCDLSSSIMSNIFEALVKASRDILEEFDPTSQEFLGYPSIVGVQLAWEVASKVYQSNTAYDTPFAVSMSSMCTKFDHFCLFIKLSLLSRIVMDWVSRENHLID